MNAKLIFKTVFLIVVLLMLVLIGMNNPSEVTFSLPPVLPKRIKLPAAIMYFAFFAIGIVTGTILTAGSGKKGAGSSQKSGKSDK